jgi:hypothetical protein
MQSISSEGAIKKLEQDLSRLTLLTQENTSQVKNLKDTQLKIISS